MDEAHLIEADPTESRRLRRQYTYSCVLRRWRPDVEWPHNPRRRRPPSTSSLAVSIVALCSLTRSMPRVSERGTCCTRKKISSPDAHREGRKSAPCHQRLKSNSIITHVHRSDAISIFLHNVFDYSRPSFQARRIYRNVEDCNVTQRLERPSLSDSPRAFKLTKEREAYKKNTSTFFIRLQYKYSKHFQLFPQKFPLI